MGWWDEIQIDPGSLHKYLIKRNILHGIFEHYLVTQSVEILVFFAAFSLKVNFLMSMHYNFSSQIYTFAKVASRIVRRITSVPITYSPRGVLHRLPHHL